jgi:hypothetical protein
MPNPDLPLFPGIRDHSCTPGPLQCPQGAGSHGRRRASTLRANGTVSGFRDSVLRKGGTQPRSTPRQTRLCCTHRDVQRLRRLLHRTLRFVIVHYDGSQPRMQRLNRSLHKKNCLLPETNLFRSRRSVHRLLWFRRCRIRAARIRISLSAPPSLPHKHQRRIHRDGCQPG